MVLVRSRPIEVSRSVPGATSSLDRPSGWVTIPPRQTGAAADPLGHDPAAKWIPSWPPLKVMVYKCNGQPNQRWSVQWQSPRGVIASRAIARQITPGDEIANHCGAVVSKRALMSVVTGPSWKMYRAPCADCSPMADQLPSDSSPGDAPASMV